MLLALQAFTLQRTAGNWCRIYWAGLAYEILSCDSIEQVCRFHVPIPPQEFHVPYPTRALSSTCPALGCARH